MANAVTALATVLCLWGAAHLIAAAIRPHACHIALPILQLVGLGGVSLAGFAVCAVGFAEVPLPAHFEAMAAQPTLRAVFYLWGACGSMLWLRTDARRTLRNFGVLDPERALLWVLATLLVVLSVWTLLPSYRVDEPLYHLTLPTQYLLRGGFAVIEGHGNASFPAFGEMVSFWPLACGSFAAARAVQLLVMWLGICSVAAALPTRRVVTLWGCFLMVTTPVVFCFLPTCYVDVVQAVYGLVGFACLARYDEAQRPADLMVAAWLLGCAVATKYLALPLLPLAGLAFLWGQRDRQRRGAATAPAALGAAAACLLLAPLAPWVGRNLVVWGSPLYPFMADVFPPRGHGLAAEQLRTLASFLAQYGPTDDGTPVHGIMALLRLPIDLFWRARFDRPEFSGVIGPMAYCVLASVLVLRGQRGRGPSPPLLPRWVVGYGLFMAVVWLATSWQLRFLSSAYFVLCLAASASFDRLTGAGVRRLFVAAYVACALFNALAIWQSMPPWDLRMFRSPAEVHALRLQHHPKSAVCDALNEEASLHPDVPIKATLVWMQRVSLWCNTPIMSDSYDEAASFNAWLAEASAEQTVQALRAMQVTHVVIDEALFFDTPPGALDEEETARLSRIFARYAVLKRGVLQEVTRRGATALFAVRFAPPGSGHGAGDATPVEAHAGAPATRPRGSAPRSTQGASR